MINISENIDEISLNIYMPLIIAITFMPIELFSEAVLRY